ncbi:hypothetical protein VCHC81A2_2491, partial [Vibrio cholerae HC-81A2]
MLQRPEQQLPLGAPL